MSGDTRQWLAAPSSSKDEGKGGWMLKCFLFGNRSLKILWFSLASIDRCRLDVRLAGVKCIFESSVSFEFEIIPALAVHIPEDEKQASAKWGD